MLRLLVVMVVVGLAVTYLIQRENGGAEATSTEQVYRQQTEHARDLEQQLQDQAQRQLDRIDQTD